MNYSLQDLSMYTSCTAPHYSECITLYCTDLLLKWVFCVMDNSARDFWRRYGKFVKVTFEIHDSTELGHLKVIENPTSQAFEMLWSPWSKRLLRRSVAWDLETCRAGFCEVMELTPAKWCLRCAIEQDLKVHKVDLRRYEKPTKWSVRRVVERDLLVPRSRLSKCAVMRDLKTRKAGFLFYGKLT